MDGDQQSDIMGSGFITSAVSEGRRCFGKLALLNIAQCSFPETLGAAARTDIPENVVAAKAEPLCRFSPFFGMKVAITVLPYQLYLCSTDRQYRYMLGLL